MRGDAKHLVFGVCIAFVLLSAFGGVASAKTIYVPDDYGSIQQAVHSASDGDTIIVRDGTYYENIFVDRQLTIRSENGSDSTIVQAANSNKPVFKVTADYVSISGFTIKGATAGIYLRENSHCEITGNNILNNNDGIYLYNSYYNKITNNNVNSNHDGILLILSGINDIINNTINSNNDDGIVVLGSCSNNIINNTINMNNDDAIYLSYVCIPLSGCFASVENRITKNMVNSNNGDGIHLAIPGTDDESHNYIYLNNFINNTNNVYSYASVDIWNSISKITYIYKGSKYTNYLGNYWSDYTGSDADGDGIGDTPYAIDGDADNYPLMQPWENYETTKRTLVVNQTDACTNGDLYFSTISDAVTNANDNDTIIVCPGTYNENVDVDKSVEIRSYSQNTSDTVVKASNPNDHVFYVTADNVYISGFTVTGATGSGKAGIYLYKSNNCRIENVNASNNIYGIYFGYSSNNTIANNTASNNIEGIYLRKSSNNILVNNTVSSNNDDGIALGYSSNNTIANNTVSSNKCNGFFLWDSSSNNIIANNTASNNWYGIYLESSSNNIIYLNNFIDNTDQVESYSSTNIWNSTEQITYTYDGKQHTNYLGNYWSDYTGSDADGDWIGDAPYIIDGDKDNYPLVERFEHYIGVTPAPNQPPIANFTYYPEKPVVNQSVTFDASSSYDPDGTIVSYEWDFGDGTTASGVVVTHAYSAAGSYTVTLTV
ncbi:NosD domain-containing protein, partial [Candidatus Alkanophaga liquidiphilum]